MHSASNSEQDLQSPSPCCAGRQLCRPLPFQALRYHEGGDRWLSTGLVGLCGECFRIPAESSTMWQQDMPKPTMGKQKLQQKRASAVSGVWSNRRSSSTEHDGIGSATAIEKDSGPSASINSFLSPPKQEVPERDRADLPRQKHEAVVLFLNSNLSVESLFRSGLHRANLSSWGAHPC